MLDLGLDVGITREVEVLRAAGFDTFESCEGGEGHAYIEPAVRFHGNQSDGFRALSVALASGLQVRELRRLWRVEDGDPVGPWWELTFSHHGPDTV